MAKKTREERWYELNSLGYKALGLLIPKEAQVQIPIPKDWWDCSGDRLREQIREAIVEAILATEYPDQAPKRRSRRAREVRKKYLETTPIIKVLDVANELGIEYIERPERKALGEYLINSTPDWDERLINAILLAEGYPDQ